MFQVTGATDVPMSVNAGFWQWFKAGFAFTMGAIVVMSVASILYYLFVVNVMLAVLARLK